MTLLQYRLQDNSTTIPACQTVAFLLFFSARRVGRKSLLKRAGEENCIQMWLTACHKRDKKSRESTIFDKEKNKGEPWKNLDYNMLCHPVVHVKELIDTLTRNFFHQLPCMFFFYSYGVFLWLARLLSLCLFGRLATKFFFALFGWRWGVGRVYRRLSQWIFVCWPFFPTFSLQVMWCDFWATNLPSTTLNSWRLMETFCSLEPRKFWAPFPFPFLSIYVENLLSKQKNFVWSFPVMWYSSSIREIWAKTKIW